MSRIFYRVFNALAQSDIPPDAGDFRLMDRSVVAALSDYRERNSVYEGSVFGGRIQDGACCVRDAGPAGGRDQVELLEIMELRFGRHIQLLDRPDPHMDLCRRTDRERELALYDSGSS